MPASLRRPDGQDLVAVVGIGAVSAAGVGVPALETAVREGRRCFGPARRLDLTGHAIDRVAEAPVDDETKGLRALRLARLAADEALAGAGWDAEALRESALWIGGSTGGMREAEAWRASVLAEQRAAITPPLSLIIGQPLWSTTSQLAAALGIGGPHLTVNTACSSSANAILLGAWQVRWGRVPRALVGGVEVLTRMTQSGFGALGLLDPEGCRPFDEQRRGLTLGEGSAFLALEPLAQARARGARVHAVVMGGAIGAEAHHPTAPEPGGSQAARVIGRALADAFVEAAELDYVNAHGTGTPQNDLAETQALHAALGERGSSVPVSSSKSMIGHTLGAAGAIESLITVLALERGFLPPTAGLVRPDPACALAHVVGVARAADLVRALKTSFGFGGNLTALVLGRAGS